LLLLLVITIADLVSIAQILDHHQRLYAAKVIIVLIRQILTKFIAIMDTGPLLVEILNAQILVVLAFFVHLAVDKLARLAPGQVKQQLDL